jgi:hypothetical protein
MAKMKLDPKKMAVVKKTVTTAGPVAKSKNGIPKTAKEAIAYFDSEIARHDELLKQLEAEKKGIVYPKSKTGSYLVGSPEEKQMIANSKRERELLLKGNKITDAKYFLQQQRQKNADKIAKIRTENELKASRQKEANKPFLEKTKDVIRKLGSSGNPVF